MENSSSLFIQATGLLAIGFLASCSGYGGGDGSPATVTMTINPTTINVGQSATITWTSNGSRCTASGAWTGPKAGNGSEQVTPAAAGTFTYTLVCTGGGYGESTERSVTLTVNTLRAAALWSGEACCLNAAGFDVTGMTNDAGEHRFLLLDTHYIREAGKESAAYATSTARLAGERRQDAPEFKVLFVRPGVSVQERLRSTGRSGQLAVLEFSTPHNLPSGPADLPGSYTSNLGTGYTLTITVEADGAVSGSDTNGCRLAGRAARGTLAGNAYDLVLDVSSCGKSNGRYTGQAGLIADASGRASELFLSTSNQDSAIAWRLSR